LRFDVNLTPSSKQRSQRAQRPWDAAVDRNPLQRRPPWARFHPPPA
jgi:hypothetical protein